MSEIKSSRKNPKRRNIGNDVYFMSVVKEAYLWEVLHSWSWHELMDGRNDGENEKVMSECVSLCLARSQKVEYKR